MIQPAFEILNQRGTPMFFSDVFANRPAAGIVGRIFISTDTKEFYRDTGSTWELIGGPGAGTITGSGTAGTLPIWATSSSIGNSSLLEALSKFTTTKDFQADAFFLNGMTSGNGALYWTSDRVTLANYNTGGSVYIEVNGGNYAQNIAPDLSTTFYGSIIRNGGLSTQFLKADGSLDSSSYITTNIYNGNGTLTGNRDVSLNSNYLSFAGGQTYIGSQTTSSGLLTINNSSADAHVQVVGANSPSIRIDNAGTGATQRFVIGLSTATNNFIQGSTAGDICISTASANHLLFGMWQTINASEVMRLTTANNVLIGSSVDPGYKLNVVGSSPLRVYGTNGNAIIMNPSYNYYDAYNHIFRALNATTTYMTIDNFGNLGLGVTPSAWATVSPVFQIGTASLYGYNNTLSLSSNSYYNVGDKYIQNGYATQYYQANGAHYWYNAPSGTAGNAISFTQAMTLTNGGNLGLGTINPDNATNYSTLSVNGNSGGQITFQTSGSKIGYIYNTSSNLYVGADASKNLIFDAGGIERMRITSSGNLLVGTSVDSGIKFDCNGYGRFEGRLYVNDNATASQLQFLGISSTVFGIQGRDNTGGSNRNICINSDGGNVLIGSNINQGQKLYLNGSLRIDGQTSGTAGGNSGQHLIINCDGTTYKIALLNN